MGKQQIKLHEDETEALRLYHEIIAALPKERPRTAEQTVADVFDCFLTWCEQHQAPSMFKSFKTNIQGFCSALPETETMPVASLKPFYVMQYVDSHKGWGDSMRR